MTGSLEASDTLFFANILSGEKYLFLKSNLTAKDDKISYEGIKWAIHLHNIYQIYPIVKVKNF